MVCERQASCEWCRFFCNLSLKRILRTQFWYLWLFTLGIWDSWSLYGCRPKTQRKIQEVVVCDRSTSCERCGFSCKSFLKRILRNQVVVCGCLHLVSEAVEFCMDAGPRLNEKFSNLWYAKDQLRESDPHIGFFCMISHTAEVFSTDLQFRLPTDVDL